jgi:undecaprenyl-diphosphatase
LRRYRRAVLAIALLLAAFVLLTVLVLGGATTGFDHAIMVALRDADGSGIGPGWLSKAMLNWSALGSGHNVTIIVIVAALGLLISKRPREAGVVIACSLGTSILVNTLKPIFERARPSIVQHIDTVTGFSFPSGHTTTATAIYATLGVLVASGVQERRLKIFVFAISAFIPLLVGSTRVFLGVHYPTDVLGGWCLGLAWALALGVINDMLQRRGMVEQ